nr:unnamed protein product [Digitaria exilis]
MALPSPPLAADAAVGQGSTGLLPEGNCTTMCGDVAVPYPFGTTAGCYLPGFNLTCDTNHEPPRLSLGDGTLQVVGISLENSTVRVVGPDIPMVESVWKDYVANGTWGGQGWGLSDEGPYILSEEHNEFVLLGCALFAELGISGLFGNKVINTCGSICSGEVLDNGHDFSEQPNSRRCQKCSGLGCCQTLQVYGHINVPYSVFISEEGWFQPYNSSMSLSAIPAVLVWAIVSNVLPHVSDNTRDGNATCPKDLGSTACHSSYSSCRNMNRPYGSNHTASYTCSCWEGYQGNPYLPDGCQGT